METIQKNLLKRTKGRYNTKYKLADCYREYLRENPRGSDFYVDYITYKLINTTMLEKIFDRILYNSSEIVLPYRLGALSVLKKKMDYNRLRVDYKTSMETGIRVYHMNDHSNGYQFKIRWRKHIAIFKNRKYYCFIPTRTHNRLLAKLVKEGKNDYFTL
jgi:hypothetical protein